MSVRLLHCALKISLAAIFWVTKFVWFLYRSVSEQSLVSINIIILLIVRRHTWFNIHHVILSETRRCFFKYTVSN